MIYPHFGESCIRLTHVPTGTAVQIWYHQGSPFRTLHAAHTAARRWLWSRVLAPAEPPRPVRTYSLDLATRPDRISEGGVTLATGPAVRPVLGGRGLDGMMAKARRAMMEGERSCLVN